MTYQLDVYSILTKVAKTLGTLPEGESNAQLVEDARHAAAKCTAAAMLISLEPISKAEILRAKEVLLQARPALVRLWDESPADRNRSWMEGAINGWNAVMPLLEGMACVREAIPDRPEDAPAVPQGFRRLIPSGWLGSGRS